MRIRALFAAGLLVAFAACSGDDPASPTGGGGGAGTAATAVGTGGDGGPGSGTGGGTGGGTGTPTSSSTPTSGDVAVIVGSIFMTSRRTGTVNPAMDSGAVGGSSPGPGLARAMCHTGSSHWRAPRLPPDPC